MAEVTIVAVAAAVPMLVLTLVQLARLGRWWDDPLGRLVFGMTGSAKFWLICFLAYVATGAILDGVPQRLRQWINMLLALGIFAQSTLVALALRRYRRRYGVQPRREVVVPVEPVTVQQAVDLIAGQQEDAEVRRRAAQDDAARSSSDDD